MAGYASAGAFGIFLVWAGPTIGFFISRLMRGGGFVSKSPKVRWKKSMPRLLVTGPFGVVSPVNAFLLDHVDRNRTIASNVATLIAWPISRNRYGRNQVACLQ